MEASFENIQRRFSGLRRIEDDVRGQGPIGAWFKLAMGYGENVVRVSGTVVQVSRREALERMRSTVDWAAGFPKGGFEVAATVTDAADVLFQDAFGRVEKAALTLLGTIDHTGSGVGEVTGRAVAGVVKGRDDNTSAIA